MPNPRGSYGEGEAFTQANRKDFGYGDLRDILAGVDTVSAKFPIDQQRIGLTGWSYGGFMTMFAVTQTQRFHAAVAGAGIANWQSYYGENSIDQWMTPFFGASVYENPAVYAKSSAIDFIRNVKTPTLVVVGDRDGECPAPQSFEFWHALRAEHVPTELVVYPDEGHRFNSPQHRRDVLARALAWFEQYMPPQELAQPPVASGPVPSTLRTLTTHNSARASERCLRCRRSGNAQSRSHEGRVSLEQSWLVEQVRQASDLRLLRHHRNARGVAFPQGRATGKIAAPAYPCRRFALVVHQPPGAATPGGEVSCSGF